MASRGTKMTIHVTPSRHAQTTSFRTSGRIGKVSMSIPTTYLKAQPLAPATDEKAYWNAVIVAVQAKILSM